VLDTREDGHGPHVPGAQVVAADHPAGELLAVRHRSRHRIPLPRRTGDQPLEPLAQGIHGAVQVDDGPDTRHDLDALRATDPAGLDLQAPRIHALELAHGDPVDLTARVDADRGLGRPQHRPSDQIDALSDFRGH
jgi:hypothetical protein